MAMTLSEFSDFFPAVIRHLLLGDERNGSSSGNRSIDVLCKNCLSNFDTVACYRELVVSVLAAVTTCLCVGRILSLHLSGAAGSLIRVFLYYVLTLHCIAGSLEWALGWSTPIALALSYAKATELLLVCYYYLDVAVLVSRWRRSYTSRRLCSIGLLLFFVYFTALLAMGLTLLSIEPWVDCHAPYWIWFSMGDFVVVQLIVLSFIYIHRQVSRLSALRQHPSFWPVWAFEISALSDVAYHLAVFLLADHDGGGCSAIFMHSQMRYTLVKLAYDLLSLLLPVWTLLLVFGQPDKRDRLLEAVAEEETEEESDAGSTSSSPQPTNFRNELAVRPLVLPGRRHDQRYQPIRRGTRTLVSGVGGLAPTPPQTTVPGFRRVQTMPAIVSPGSSRRASVSAHSLLSSPLFPIVEDGEDEPEDEDGQDGRRRLPNRRRRRRCHSTTTNTSMNGSTEGDSIGDDADDATPAQNDRNQDDEDDEEEDLPSNSLGRLSTLSTRPMRGRRGGAGGR